MTARNRTSSLACALVTPLVALWLVHSYNTAEAGYTAVYSVVLMWMVSVPLILVGLICVCSRQAKWLGKRLLGCGLGIALCFFAGIRISERVGWNFWLNQPMVKFGPDVVASEVVYFDLGATEAEIEEFQRAALYVIRGRGFDLKPGITSFMTLLPSQAYGHNGFAITLSSSLPDRQREELRATFSASRLVFRVYDDTAPDDIPPPPP